MDIILPVTKQQEEFINCKNRYISLIAGRRFGKSTDIHTKVPTPDGYTTIGELKVGDKVIGSDGNQTIVTELHPIHTPDVCYRLTFDDGQHVDCCADHLWDTATKYGSCGRKNASRLNREHIQTTKTTQEIVDTLKVGKKQETNHSIDLVQFRGSYKNLEIHPYMLGVWLGDGYRHHGMIASGYEKEPIHVRLQSIGYSISSVKWDKSIAGNYWPQYYYSGLKSKLKDLGLICNKHIPVEYLRASVEQRFELLRGLMDTDGSCQQKNGTCEISLSNERLAKDVYQLICSLGIKARFYTGDAWRYKNGKKFKKGKIRYRIGFYRYRHQEPVFHLEYKQKNIKDAGRKSGQDLRYIVKAEKIDSIPMRCITVDAEDSLYCITEGFITTHNTLSIAYRFIAEAMNPTFYGWYISPTSAQNEQILDFFSTPDIQFFIKKFKKSYPQEITFSTGARVSFRTFMRPERLRGKGVNCCVVDEIQDIADRMGFWSVIRPLLSDKRGRLIISGQHRGHGWFYNDLYIKGVEGQPKYNPRYKSFSFPTSSGIAFQSPEGIEELEDAKSQVPKIVWDQEYECIPTENIYSVFRADDLDLISEGEITDKARVNAETGEVYKYIDGLDLGKTVDNSFHVVIEVGGQVPTVAYTEQRPLKEKHSMGAIAAQKISQRFRNCTVVIDTTGGATGGYHKHDTFTKYYKQHVPTMKPFYWGRNKQEIINDLAMAIEQGKLHIPAEHEILHHQLRIYEYKTRFAGIEYGAPQGEHDDAVAALAMAWHGVLKGWYGRSPTGIENVI